MKLAHSPLFEPVLWEGNSFKILDELLLPEKIEYISVRDVPQALAAVREMRTRAFGQVLTFLYSGALIARNYKAKEPEPLRDQLAQMTQQFCAARATFDFKGLGDYYVKWFDDLPIGAHAGEWIVERARGLAGQIVKARQARAKRTASILPNPARVLTHCNVSGELVAAAQYCKEMGKEISVIATETRPYLQGARLTAWELARAGVPISLIPDCAIAQVIARGEVNAVVVGSDRCARNGDIINKVGTYPLALMAKEYEIPFYVLIQEPGSLQRGSDVPIEERPADELLIFQGQSLIPEGGDKIKGRYPAFDVTPASLISSLIGFDNQFTPESFRQKYQGESAATTGRRKGQAKYLLVYGLPRRSDYSSLASVLKAEQAHSMLVPEMRPELWGSQVVARQFLKHNVPTTMISDNMMGTLFAQGEIRRLYLFYSRLCDRGPSGICGSLLAVRLARLHSVPVELLESEEESHAATDRDVSTFLGQKVCPAGVSIYSIERELLPWGLFKDLRRSHK